MLTIIIVYHKEYIKWLIVINQSQVTPLLIDTFFYYKPQYRSTKLSIDTKLHKITQIMKLII